MTDPRSQSIALKPEQDAKGRFVAGNSGNGGRPKGARAKLGEAFLQGLFKDFQEHGQVTIETVRGEKPDQYLKVIASLLPKEITGEGGAAIGIQVVERVIVRPSAPGADD